MEFESNLTKFLVQKIHYFRGYTLIISSFLKVFPVSSLVKIKVIDKSIYLDAKYRSQLGILKNNNFEKGLLNFYEKNIKPNDIIFDVGCNWGYFTMIFSELVKEGGKVFSFEANFNTYKVFLKTINKHRLTNVIPFFNAISSQKGEKVSISLPWYKNDTGGFIKSEPEQGTVLTQSLNNIWNLIGKQKVKCVKIDIEGFEPLALLGGEEFFKNGVTDFVIIEISDWSKKRCGISHEEIFTMMKEYGYKYIYFAENDDAFKQVDANEMKVNCNVLFSKSILAI